MYPIGYTCQARGTGTSTDVALSSCAFLRVANGVFSLFRHMNVSRVGTVTQKIAEEINGL